MGTNRVVDTTLVKRIPISDGDWIEVKKELNTGDQKKLEACGLKEQPVLIEGRPFNMINWAVHDIERATIFLTDWSLQDFSKDPAQPLPLTFASLAALDTESFEEINRAILNHTLEIAAAKKLRREAKAKAQSTPPAPNSMKPEEPSSDQTSSSVSGPVGVGTN